MKKTFFLWILILFQNISAQNIFKAVVKDEQTHEPLVGTNVYFDSLEIGGITNSNGRVEITNMYDQFFLYRLYKI